MRRIVPAILFALISFTFPLCSQAQSPAVRQEAHTDYVNQSSGSFQFNAQLTASGDLIVVACTYKPQYGRCTVPPTDSEGNIYSLVATGETANGNAGLKVYHALNIVGGTHNVITCHSETITSVGCLGVEISGANALDIGSDSTLATGNGLSIASPVTATTQPGEILLGFGGMNPGSSSTFSAYGAGWTGIVQGSQQAEYKLAAAPESDSATAGVTLADDWVMGIFGYYQSASTTFTLNPQTAAAGYTSAAKITLASPAPAGGVTFTLSSSNPSVASTPASVLIPAGSTSASFTVNTSSVTASASATITAALGAEIHTATLSVIPVNVTPQFSIWNSSAIPSIPDGGGTSPVEVGIKFQSDSTGFVTGIRFYKSAANTGAHIGNLWTASGQLLATATFTNETATGWQSASFPSPILLMPNTTYIASYHTNSGHTSVDQAYFTNIGVSNSPLHAPSSPTSGGNGVLTLGPTSQFPNVTNADSNYWVDVAFIDASSTPQLQNLTLSQAAVTGGASASGTVTLSAPAPAGGVSVNLSSSLPAIVSVPATVTVAAGATVSAAFALTTRSVNLDTTASISATFNGGTQSAPFTVSPVITLTIDQPTNLNFTVGQQATFIAATHGGNNTGITWTATCGTFVSDTFHGVYTAPASPGSCVVTARMTANPAVTTSVTVTVTQVPAFGTMTCSLLNSNTVLRCDTDITNIPSGSAITNTTSTSGAASRSMTTSKP